MRRRSYKNLHLNSFIFQSLPVARLMQAAWCMSICRMACIEKCKITLYPLPPTSHGVVAHVLDNRLLLCFKSLSRIQSDHTSWIVIYKASYPDHNQDAIQNVSHDTILASNLGYSIFIILSINQQNKLKVLDFLYHCSLTIGIVHCS